MGVSLMENFEVGSVAVLAEKGWILPATNNSIGTVTENGFTRKRLIVARPLAAQSFDAIKIPIPSSKEFYFSTRVAYYDSGNNGIADAGLRLYIATSGTFSDAGSNGRLFGFAMPANGAWTFYTANTNSGNSRNFGVFERIKVEVYRKADGTTKVWVNDFPLINASLTTTAPADNYIYIGRAQSSQSSGGNSNWGWDYMDTVVVDPSTPGLKYRPGAAARVVSVPMTADVQANWLPPTGVTTPHYSLMADYPAAVDTNKILTGDTVGQRDQYQAGAVPVVVPGANKVLSVQLEQRSANPGAALHTYATEIDTGTGITEVAQNQIAAGGVFVYRPVFIDKKPDGTNWTAADVAALKAGFSLKS